MKGRKPCHPKLSRGRGPECRRETAQMPVTLGILWSVGDVVLVLTDLFPMDRP